MKFNTQHKHSALTVQLTYSATYILMIIDYYYYYYYHYYYYYYYYYYGNIFLFFTYVYNV